eukprot:gene24389-biopygen18867
MFSITVPNVDLPVDLGFTQDFDLKLAIGDDGDVVVCGRHWTLFTTVTQPMADFEAAYGILQQTAMVSCAAAAAAEPPPLDIDDSCMPFDKLTYAVVVALEELVDNSCCPNTRVFAWLYAKHLRAADMDFMDLLQTPAIANMASTALDAWFVRHPMFRAQAHEAQDLLITVLDDYTPSRPRYEPYWEFDLKLSIGDDGDVVVCGRHWTLFTTVTQPMADFEAAYGIMQQTAMVSCAAAAAAKPPPLDIGVKDAMLIPDVIKDNWYKGDYGLGQVAHFLLKGSVKKTGAGRGGYYIFEEDTCQWVKVDGGRVKSVAVEAMEAALRDVDAWISTSMMVADLDLKRREVLRLIRYTRSHRGVTNVMAFAGPMLRDETFEVGGGNDTDDDDDDDPSSITEMVLAEKFRYAAPEFFRRIKFVPEVKKKECVGDMYYCDPATNRWSNCSNTKITNAIATEFNSKFPSEKNNKKIRLFLDTVRGRSAFLQSVACLVLDETFADNLDNNPDLFAVNNGVFDSSSRDTVVFRNVEMTDNISRCAKWDYQGEDNYHLQRCKEELDDFLRKVMPVDEERDVVLAFFAGLMSGRRKEKKFLAFTDKTSGDNGKSTLMALLGSFFDEYGSSNGTKFMTKGSFARSRDDHDAGLKPMKGVRLLVAEEMKPNITLDEAFIKRIAGGEGVRVCGSSCDTGNSFDFLWQAGIVIVFNEGDCPKFDGGDTAFVKRMVVVPMRSNFVLHPDPQREHEFERRDNLEDALPTWRSALAQLLIEHFRRPGRSSIFDNLPVSMTEWKSGIADCANPLTEWLEEVVEMTGASSDAVWIGDLKVRWKESHYGEASVFSTKMVKAFFVGKQGTEWKETGRIDTKVKYGKSLQPLMWDMLAAGGNESCKELLNTFRVAYATGLIDYIRQMCGDDVCNPKQVGTVNVNYSSDIDVNLNFNGEILHNDLDRIVLIFKSIKDYHYQRFKRNFTDMFDINIYGSHFGMLNNPKSAKSKEEIYLISNDPQQRLFAMGKLAIMCKWSDREDMLKARDFIKKQPTYNSNNNEKLYTSYLKKYFAIDRNNTTTTTSRTGAVSGIVKVGRIFSMTKLLENDVYWSVGAFLHIVSGRKDLTESMYVDSMLDNTGFIVSNLRKKHVCKKEVSPYTTVLRVAKRQQKQAQAGGGLFSTKEVTSEKVMKELAKIPPGDLINRMNMNINTSLIKKTSTLDEQNAITHLVEIIETAMKQKDDFDKATRDFYTVYDKLKTAIFEACQTGPKLCGTVNGAMKTQKKNS